MKAWRIQYYEYGVTFDKTRDASLYCKRIHDAEVIGKIFVKVATWQDWQKAVAKIRSILKTNTACGYIYYAEPGRQTETLHGQRGQRISFATP